MSWRYVVVVTFHIVANNTKFDKEVPDVALIVPSRELWMVPWFTALNMEVLKVEIYAIAVDVA